MARILNLIVFSAMLILLATLVWRPQPASAQEDKAALMERLSTEIANSPLLDSKSKELVTTKLLPIIDNEVLVGEIKAQNDKNVSLDEIKKLDNEWKAAEGDVPLLEELRENATAVELEKLLEDLPRIVECFVMDNQGANVGQYNDTSDYWQGDEAKWKNSYNGGKGGVDIGEKEIDKSTTLAQQQVSLPMIDSDGTVVGAVTFGLIVK